MTSDERVRRLFAERFDGRASLQKLARACQDAGIWAKEELAGAEIQWAAEQLTALFEPGKTGLGALPAFDDEQRQAMIRIQETIPHNPDGSFKIRDWARACLDAGIWTAAERAGVSAMLAHKAITDEGIETGAQAIPAATVDRQEHREWVRLDRATEADWQLYEAEHEERQRQHEEQMAWIERMISEFQSEDETLGEVVARLRAEGRG